MTRSPTMAAARVVGGITSIACTVLWTILVFAGLYGAPRGSSLESHVVPWIMIALAAIGIAASILGIGLLLAVVSVLSFVPVGFYLAWTPGVFRWIGMLDLLMLLAALTMSLARRSLS